MIRLFSQYVPSRAIFLVLTEMVLISACVHSSVKLRFWNDPEAFAFYTMLPDFAAQVFAVVVCIQICFYYNELYDLRVAFPTSDQFTRLAQSLGAACVLLGLLYFLFPALLIGRGVFFITVALVVSSVMLTRFAIDTLWRATVPHKNVLILGTGQTALSVARELMSREDLPLRLIGFTDTEPTQSSQDRRLCGHPVLGCASGLESVVERHRISRVVVALEEHRGVLPMQSLLRLRVSGVEVEDSHSTMAALTGRVPLQTLRSSWFIFSDGFHRTGWTEVVKRALDLSLGLLGLVLSAPIMALAAIAIKWDSEGPVLYRQTRVGRRGKPFDVLKFRTMGADAETNGIPQWAEEDDPRVTRLGRFLRKYRVDELPQFVNVIRGQMSFVGPRPERPVFVEELRQIIPYYDERHTVRPGITGWAQVRYGYGGSTEEAMRKLEYDLFYLKNMSVWFDAAIVFETVKIVMFGRGGR